MGKLRQATRTRAKIRLGLSAVSGGGKTMSALLIAKGICGDLSKVALIDTENGSGDLYAHLGSYNVLPLEPDFTPEKYISAIHECENAGMEVIIIDSITHEWDGKGGILDISNSMSGNSYTNWAKLTPRHQAFIDAILQSKCHIITTVRRKQDYEMTTNSSGKLVPQKVGLKEVTREGFEYELTINLELDTKHNASASKDRTGLFIGKPEFVPSEETGKLIKDWCETGVDESTAITDAVTKLANCNTVDELKALKIELPDFVVKSPVFTKSATERYNAIIAQSPKEPAVNQELTEEEKAEIAKEEADLFSKPKNKK
jgi:hypothetical protein